MKNSNIQWIGEIPDDWEVLKNKYNFELSKEIVGVKSASTQLLSLTKNGIKAITEDQQNGKVPASFNTYQVVKKDDIVMCLFDLDVSAVFSGISNYEGMISPAYKCFKCKPHLNPKYVDYYFRAVFVDRKYKRYSKNVRYSISAEEFMTLPILVPPLATQTSIATYLDAKCSEIDGLIADINKQIETLNELKKSTITEAVTKGLNKNAKLKDSGIQWIGMIPEGWKESRVKYVSSLFGRIGFRGYTQQDLVDEDNGAITLSPSNMKNMKMNYEKCSYISWFKYNESPEIKVENGDILFVKTGSTYGKSAYVSELPKEATINPQLIVFKQSIMDKKMLAYILQTSLISYQTELAVVGGTIPTMSQEKIKNFVLPLPPLTEQHAIATYLDSKCSEFDSIISDKQKQISTLEAYKKSLIYEYVTGKKEVEL